MTTERVTVHLDSGGSIDMTYEIDPYSISVDDAAFVLGLYRPIGNYLNRQRARRMRKSRKQGLIVDPAVFADAATAPTPIECRRAALLVCGRLPVDAARCVLAMLGLTSIESGKMDQ
jgi:hypothetical protein